MACRDAPPATSIQHGMDSDEAVLLEDADLARGAVHLDRTAARAVGHAVEVAVNRDHAIAGDAAFEAQDRLERPARELLKLGALFGKMLGDDAPSRGMHTRIGDLVEPLPQLLVEIIEIAEAAAEKEVLADVAIRPLDLPLQPYLSS
jgi:hypothetical protein